MVLLLYTFSVLNPSCLLLLPLPNAIGVTPPLHCLPQPGTSLKLDAPPHTCYRFLQLAPPPPGMRHVAATPRVSDVSMRQADFAPTLLANSCTQSAAHSTCGADEA